MDGPVPRERTYLSLLTWFCWASMVFTDGDVGVVGWERWAICEVFMYMVDLERSSPRTNSVDIVVL
jgi:hypothetical protein